MLFQLKVALEGVKPPVWRRVLVPSAYTLEQLHEVIQISMGWTSTHLYQFRIGRDRYRGFDEDGGCDSAEPASVRLASIANKGDRFSYEYDFGDGWDHTVLVEDTVAAAGPPQPACLGGRRACPPEDVGGPWGYAGFLEALA